MKVNVIIADSRVSASGGIELVLSVIAVPQGGEGFNTQRLSPDPVTYLDGTESPTTINQKVIEAIKNACLNAPGINIQPSSLDITVMKFT